MDKTPVTIFWFRRDLRLDDNAGLYYALKDKNPVLCLFIFDRAILDKLEDKDDARVTFLYQTIIELDQELKKHGSSLLVKYNDAGNAWDQIIEEYPIAKVYCNHDYEPYARNRDDRIGAKLKDSDIAFDTYKDQVIFEKSEIVKDGGRAYTIYTPYKNKWYQKLNAFYLKAYPTQTYLKNLYRHPGFVIPSLESMGFQKSGIEFPGRHYQGMIKDYAAKRDFPAIEKGTSHIGLHLRFGTVSIRTLACNANSCQEKTWLNELIWREFYMMILYHFPYTITQCLQT